MQSKVTDWLAAGCRLVWVVYPDTQTVTEYHSLKNVQVLTAEQALEGSKLLPGFTCSVSDLFT